MRKLNTEGIMLLGAGGAGMRVLEHYRNLHRDGEFDFYFYDISRTDLEVLEQGLKVGYIPQKGLLLPVEVGGAGKAPPVAKYIANKLARHTTKGTALFVKSERNYYISSLVGGTGSGTVCGVIENIRNKDTAWPHFCVSILDSTHGNQGKFNQLFNFVFLNQRADCVFLVDNDAFRYIDKRKDAIVDQYRQGMMKRLGRDEDSDFIHYFWVNQAITTMLDLLFEVRTSATYPASTDTKDIAGYFCGQQGFDKGGHWAVPFIFPLDSEPIPVTVSLESLVEAALERGCLCRLGKNPPEFKGKLLCVVEGPGSIISEYSRFKKYLQDVFSPHAEPWVFFTKGETLRILLLFGNCECYKFEELLNCSDDNISDARATWLRGMGFVKALGSQLYEVMSLDDTIRAELKERDQEVSGIQQEVNGIVEYLKSHDPRVAFRQLISDVLGQDYLLSKQQVNRN